MKRSEASTLTSNRAEPNLRDAPFLQMSMRAQGFLGTFLIALAALQRGLEVSFHFLPEKVKAKDAERSHLQVGRTYSISDGKRRYSFSSTSGEFTSSFARVMTIRKDTQKSIFAQGGIPVPVGLVSNSDKIQADLARIEKINRASRFVIKPVDGSLARDTYVNLSYSEAIEIAAAFPHREFMLEEFVNGPEYRFTVVDGRVVGVFERKPPFVIGNGYSSIAELINIKNNSRATNPFLARKPISTESLITNRNERDALSSKIPANG